MQTQVLPNFVKVKRKISPAYVALKTVAILGLAFLCVIFLFPVLWMIVSSLKTQEQIYAQLSSWRTFLPATWNVSKWFVSYKNLFNSFDYFGRSILNSVIYCSVTILGVLLLNSFAGYALARLEFPGSRVIGTIVLLLIIVPVETSIVPLYVILKNLGLLTKELRVVGYLIPNFVSAFYIFMFRQFFVGMPKELEEAARIDGSGRLSTYFRIIMPLSKAIFATVAIFTFMGAWNEYVFAQLMFSKPEQQPLQVFLQLVNSFNPKDLSMVMAALTFSTIPIAIVYVFCQRYIIEGVSFSGLK
ncbi:MAG: carbohydrate ABC transporter permease [Clostridia bacterium]|nr:carbohydrate ABC transporter permease [Clostridia bacterium]